MTHALSFAVVGHTNTGKTSLMRTLLRDAAFGDVQNASATTRHVERAALGDWVYLYDTPGLEDAGGVLDWLETHTSHQQDGIDRLNAFLNSPEAQSDFSQECKVLRQLINSDAALYVLDAREPVLSKYKDELTVLSWCAKPVMPVFNFVEGADTASWQTMLSRRQLHVFAAFDTVAFDFEGEMMLWQKLATMLPENHRANLNALIAHRQHEWQHLAQSARQLLADFILDAAAYALPCRENDDKTAIQATMQTTLRQHERHMQQQLFQLYRFYQDELSGDVNHTLTTFSRDPFDPELLKEYGIRTSTGAAAGALIGLGLDALTLGTSLGLGATLGGLIGGVASNWQTLADKINGVQMLYVDTATLTLLATRNFALWRTLQTRGHAAHRPIETIHHTAIWQTQHFPDILKKARQQPKWSALNPEFKLHERAQAAQQLFSYLKNDD